MVEFTNKARKQKGKLPRTVQEVLFQLVKEIEKAGPVRGDWPNYAKLQADTHHCHLKKGSPTYVAVWREVKTDIQLVEIVYAGSHEKAPY
jgi:mRNA-degrading endonuclease RelE of RelBE toxin-antitoxin system